MSVERTEDRLLILQDQVDRLDKAFNPNQLRDASGKWVSSGGSVGGNMWVDELGVAHSSPGKGRILIRGMTAAGRRLLSEKSTGAGPWWARSAEVAGKEQTLYHGTSSKALARILKQGFRVEVSGRGAGEARWAPEHAKYSQGKVFFTTQEDVAEDYARKVSAMRRGARPVVLELVVPASVAKQFRKDAYDEWDEDARYSTVNVKPDWIKRVSVGERFVGTSGNWRTVNKAQTQKIYLVLELPDADDEEEMDKAFDPDQPRDDEGQWTAYGHGAAPRSVVHIRTPRDRGALFSSQRGYVGRTSNAAVRAGVGETRTWRELPAAVQSRQERHERVYVSALKELEELAADDPALEALLDELPAPGAIRKPQTAEQVRAQAERFAARYAKPAPRDGYDDATRAALAALPAREERAAAERTTPRVTPAKRVRTAKLLRRLAYTAGALAAVGGVVYGIARLGKVDELEDRALTLKDQLDRLDKAFDPNQARDGEGKWSSGGSGSKSVASLSVESLGKGGSSKYHPKFVYHGTIKPRDSSILKGGLVAGSYLATTPWVAWFHAGEGLGQKGVSGDPVVLAIPRTNLKGRTFKQDWEYNADDGAFTVNEPVSSRDLRGVQLLKTEDDVQIQHEELLTPERLDKAFDPNQSRDEKGKWSDTDGGGSAPKGKLERMKEGAAAHISSAADTARWMKSAPVKEVVDTVAKSEKAKDSLTFAIQTLVSYAMKNSDPAVDDAIKYQVDNLATNLQVSKGALRRMVEKLRAVRAEQVGEDDDNIKKARDPLLVALKLLLEALGDDDDPEDDEEEEDDDALTKSEDRLLILKDQLDRLDKAFNPNQSRDGFGRWTSGGLGGIGMKPSAPFGAKKLRGDHIHHPKYIYHGTSTENLARIKRLGLKAGREGLWLTPHPGIALYEGYREAYGDLLGIDKEGVGGQPVVIAIPYSALKDSKFSWMTEIYGEGRAVATRDSVPADKIKVLSEKELARQFDEIVNLKNEDFPKYQDAVAEMDRDFEGMGSQPKANAKARTQSASDLVAWNKEHPLESYRKEVVSVEEARTLPIGERLMNVVVWKPRKGKEELVSVPSLGSVARQDDQTHVKWDNGGHTIPIYPNSNTQRVPPGFEEKIKAFEAKRRGLKKSEDRLVPKKDQADQLNKALRAGN